MTLKVGIISANWGAMAHLPAWRSLEGVEVTSICTSRQETAEAAAEKFKIDRPFWDYEAMCADPDLDIIDCGTRPILRHGMVLSAFKGGKHVYNGIPFAANIDHAREMHTAWKNSGKVGIVDALSEWLPAHRLMKEKLTAGEIGTLFGGSCRFNTSLFNKPFKGFAYNWFHEGGLGVSAVRNMGSHALHVLSYLFGPIAEVVADDRIALKEWTFPDGEKLIPQNNDLVNALLRFESGLILQYQICWTSALGEGWSIDVFGEGGRLKAAAAEPFPTSQGCKLEAGTLGGAMEVVEVPDRLKSADGVGIDWTFPMPPSYPMALAMRSMVDRIEGKDGPEPAPSFEQGWQVERVQEAIRLSAGEGRWIKVADIS